MLTRVATRFVHIGAIAGSVALLVAGEARRSAPPRDTPASMQVRCTGWNAIQVPQLHLVDVAVRGPGDVWLLSPRGIYHWDGCTWRAHAPFSELAGNILEWETLVVDPDGSLVATGESEAGPIEYLGCVGESRYPARRWSYRFVDGQTRWEPIEARLRGTPKVDVMTTALDRYRTIIATSGDPASRLYAIVKHTQHIGHPDPDGVVRGWGTHTSTELWRRENNAWQLVLDPPPTPAYFDEKPRVPDAPDYLDVRAIGGSGPRDRWAVGFRSDVMPDIVHFDGREWTSHRGKFRGDMQYRLSGVASTGPNNAWVIGSSGTVLRFKGWSWDEIESPSFYDLIDVQVWPGLVRVRDGAGGVFTRSN